MKGGGIGRSAQPVPTLATPGCALQDYLPRAWCGQKRCSLMQTGRGLVLWAMMVEEEVSLGLPQCLELLFRNWSVNTPLVQPVFRMHFKMWCYLHL